MIKMRKCENAKMLRKVLFLSLVVSNTCQLTSCEDDNEMEQQLPTSQEIQQDSCPLNYKAIFSDNHTMSWEDAAALSEEVAALHFGSISGDKALRSGGRRVVNAGRVIGKSSNTLRSGSDLNALPDTLAYVCNFADSTGFAIICADDRVGCPILACVDSGTLGDTTDNPGIAIFLEGAQSFMENSILKFEEEKDSLREVAIKKIGGTPNECNTTLKKIYTGNYKLLKSKESVDALLNTTWKQSGYPYNTLIPKVCSGNDGGHAPAGCWAVAIAQIMGYYKYPTRTLLDRSTTAVNMVFNWDGITAEKDAFEIEGQYQKQLSNLLAYIGSKIDMEYGCDGSGANADNAMSFMKACGYSGTSGVDFNFTNVISQIKKKKPVIMTGKKNRTNRFLGLIYTYSGGHAWVVDGYSFDEATEEHRYQIDTNDESATKDVLLSVSYNHPLLHINWGWGGDSNGLFASGCFHTTEAENFDGDDNTRNSNYKYKHTVFPIYK